MLTKLLDSLIEEARNIRGLTAILILAVGFIAWHIGYNAKEKDLKAVYERLAIQIIQNQTGKGVSE